MAFVALNAWIAQRGKAPGKAARVGLVAHLESSWLGREVSQGRTRMSREDVQAKRKISRHLNGDHAGPVCRATAGAIRSKLRATQGPSRLDSYAIDLREGRTSLAAHGE